jgi:hypothetical protein
MKFVIRNLRFRGIKVNKKKTRIKELSDKFEEMMSAAAFAEAGEIETARQILTGRQRVLLVLTGAESDMKAARYVLNISGRIGAVIEILYIKKVNRADTFLEGYLKELGEKGIAYHLVTGKGSIKEEIIKFTDKMSDIRFVVIDSQDLGSGYEKEERTILHSWEGLECPLVLVSNIAKT